MNIAEFEKLVKTHGSKSEKWPSHLRVDAIEFSKTNKNALFLLAEEKELDKLLDSYSVESDSTIIDSILYSSTPKKSIFINLFHPIMPKVAMLSTFAIIGFVVGLSGIFNNSTNDFLNITSIAIGEGDYYEQSENLY